MANLTIFVIFSFLQLRKIRRTYCKYFKNKISETDNYLLIKDQLPNVFLQDFYTPTTQLICAFCQCKQLFLFLPFFCSKVSILLFFLVNVLRRFLLIDFLRKDFRSFRILVILSGLSALFRDMHLFINQSQVFICQASADYTCGKDFSLIFS